MICVRYAAYSPRNTQNPHLVRQVLGSFLRLVVSFEGFESGRSLVGSPVVALGSFALVVSCPR